MTRIIAVLLLLGQFEVAVETSKGYFAGTYPDTEVGVLEFLAAIRPALETEAGRFYSCAAYDAPGRDLLHSTVAERIGVVEKLRTGFRDPGIGDAPWIVRDDHIKAYVASKPAAKLDAKLVEKICVSLLPRDYMKLYPNAGRWDLYRK